MPCSRGCCDTQREHYLSVGLSATCTPTRSGRVLQQMDSDKRFAKDGPAYKRLRKEGLQPERIDGCAEIEAKAETKAQVEA